MCVHPATAATEACDYTVGNVATEQITWKTTVVGLKRARSGDAEKEGIIKLVPSSKCELHSICASAASRRRDSRNVPSTEITAISYLRFTCVAATLRSSCLQQNGRSCSRKASTRTANTEGRGGRLYEGEVAKHRRDHGWREAIHEERDREKQGYRQGLLDPAR